MSRPPILRPDTDYARDEINSPVRSLQRRWVRPKSCLVCLKPSVSVIRSESTASLGLFEVCNAGRPVRILPYAFVCPKYAPPAAGFDTAESRDPINHGSDRQIHQADISHRSDQRMQTVVITETRRCRQHALNTQKTVTFQRIFRSQCTCKPTSPPKKKKIVNAKIHWCWRVLLNKARSLWQIEKIMRWEIIPI